jgi:hypothetical protein
MKCYKFSMTFISAVYRPFELCEEDSMKLKKNEQNEQNKPKQELFYKSYLILFYCKDL